jgi:hypothetical protein
VDTDNFQKNWTAMNLKKIVTIEIEQLICQVFAMNQIEENRLLTSQQPPTLSSEWEVDMLQMSDKIDQTQTQEDKALEQEVLDLNQEDKGHHLDIKRHTMKIDLNKKCIPL